MSLILIGTYSEWCHVPPPAPHSTLGPAALLWAFQPAGVARLSQYLSISNLTLSDCISLLLQPANLAFITKSLVCWRTIWAMELLPSGGGCDDAMLQVHQRQRGGVGRSYQCDRANTRGPSGGINANLIMSFSEWADHQSETGIADSVNWNAAQSCAIQGCQYVVATDSFV
jgi:hypothetical protein